MQPGERSCHLRRGDEAIAAGTPTVISAARNTAPAPRDWAARAPQLLGIKAVIAKSFERIHRSNLVGMGVLPLLRQLLAG